MAIALYDPVVIVNNQQLLLKPNTADATLGLGEAKVEAYTAGGGVIETVHSEDLTSRFSTFKGTLTNTEKNMALVRSFKQFLGLLTVEISQGDFSIVIRHCSFVTNPVFQFKSEPETVIEFHGDPAL